MAVKSIQTTLPAGNAQLQALDRQRKLAMLLQNQALQPLDGGRMVGHHFVPNHPMQGAAKLGQALAGKYKEYQADKKHKELVEEQRQAGISDMQAFAEAVRGKKGIAGSPEIHATPPQSNPYSIYTGEAPETQGTPYQPAVAGQEAIPAMDRGQAAMQFLMNSKNPMVSQMGMGIYNKSLEPPKIIKQGKGETLHVRNPDGTLKSVASPSQGEIKPLSSFGKILADRNQYPKGSEAYKYFDAKLNKESTHKPSDKVSVTNINKSESEQAKKRGQFFGDLRSEVDKVAFDAPAQLNNINRMEQLLEGIETGSLAGVGVKISQLAKSAGITLDENLGEKEAAIALANQMAIGLRKAGTGVMTDKDFEVFLASVPSLSMTPEGRKQMMVTMRGKLNRDIEISKMAREYAKTHNGMLDDGFLDQVAQYKADNPLFAERKSTTLRPEVAAKLGNY